MKKSGFLQHLSVKTTSLLNDKSTFDTYNQEHFYITAPNPLMVSISGSTETNMEFTGPKQVLDASGLSCDSAFNMVMATADGLGESDDLDDNANNAAISAYCCEAFCTETLSTISAPDKELLKDIAAKSKAKNAPSVDHGRYDGRTAMTALSYNSQSKKAHIFTMGDTLTAVFNGKTGALKYQQKVRVYNQGGSIWAPADLQLLAHGKPQVAKFAASALQETSLDLEEDDIIVQMSDGIWSEFETIDTVIKLPGRTSYIETELRAANLSDIDAEFTVESLRGFHALDVAIRIHNKAIKHFQANLEIFRQIHEEVSTKLKLETSTEKTMAAFIKELTPRTAALFQQLFVAQKHDAIPYADDMPISSFRHHYQRISFGDCATISVLKIPNENESTLIHLLNNIKALHLQRTDLNKITLLTPEQINHLFNKLKQYQLIEADKAPLSDDAMKVGVPAYNSKSLQTLQSFVLHYKQCMELVKNEADGCLERRNILAYIRAIKDPSERHFLAGFFNNCTPSSVSEYFKHLLFKPSVGISLHDFKTNLSAIEIAPLAKP